MISIKSNREIELMKEAGRITALVHEVLKSEIKPGVTTEYLDRLAYKTILENSCTPSFLGLYDFPKSICTSVNEQIVHGIPDSKIVLKNGDIVSVDVGACFKGYHGDSAWTYPVGEISQEAKDLLYHTKKALFEGLKQVKAGVRVGDVSNCIGNYAYNHGYSVPLEYTGHGIGTAMHEDPVVPNYGEANKGPVLKAGMTLAIEPMFHIGKPFTKVLADDWTVITKDRSLAAHFEHTVLVLEDGYEILTKNIEEDHSFNE